MEEESWVVKPRFRRLPEGNYIHFDGVYAPADQPPGASKEPKYVRFFPGPSKSKYKRYTYGTGKSEGIIECKGLTRRSKEMMYWIEGNSIIMQWGSLVMKASFSKSSDGREVLHFKLHRPVEGTWAQDSKLVTDKLKWLEGELVFRLVE